MTHTSKLFGAFEYNPEQIITFPKGLLGFKDYTRFVLKRHPGADPIQWLLSVEEGGPDFPVVDPHLLDERCTVRSLHIGRDTLSKLGTRTERNLHLYAIVTVPEDIRRISMNLRAPLLICPKTRLGVQRVDPEMKTRAVRRPIYRELTGDMVEEKAGQLVLHRRMNETVQIGEDIVVEVLAIEDGGVRLAISAPKDVRIARGENRVSAERQNKEAAAISSLDSLSTLMSRAYRMPVAAAS